MISLWFSYDFPTRPHQPFFSSRRPSPNCTRTWRASRWASIWWPPRTPRSCRADTQIFVDESWMVHSWCEKWCVWMCLMGFNWVWWDLMALNLWCLMGFNGVEWLVHARVTFRFWFNPNLHGLFSTAGFYKPRAMYQFWWQFLMGAKQLPHRTLFSPRKSWDVSRVVL